MAERIEDPEAEVAAGAADLSTAAALALGVKRARSKGDHDARLDAFLEKQGRLLDLQMEHLHEQRGLQLAHLRVRRWKDRISIALHALCVVVGAAAAVLLGVVIWQAHQDHGLVVQPFSVPPDLAARGLTGEVAAGKLLDKLAELQARTDSARPPSTYANNWGDDIKVEIPETGVSIGELNRLLRRWLGHQTVISGELVRTPGGVSITARSGAEAGATFEGPDSDLDKLFGQAAEAVYRRTQPYRYGVLLTGGADPESARPLFEALAASEDANERRWAETGLASINVYTADFAAAERGYRQIALRYPDFVMGVSSVTSIADLLDHEEGGLQAARRTVALFSNGSDPQVAAEWGRVLSGYNTTVVSELTGDFQEAARRSAPFTEAPDRSGSRAAALWYLARSLALNHRPGEASAVLSDAHLLSGAHHAGDWSFSAHVAIARQIADIEEEKWDAALADDAQARQFAAGSPDPRNRYLMERQLTPWTAYAMARSGDLAAAGALIATTPLDCDQCLRMRGRIAALQGDRAGAERWFAAAVRQAPEIPFGYADWGRMLLASGDAAGAIAKLRIAREKGSHYADALELWGEALMMQRDYPGALAKFAEANSYAPRWGRNHMLWGEASMLSGRYAQARRQYETANGLDLSKPDRGALNVLLARTASGPLHG
jgi:tetratricopeptide (TPR) repeat protein